MTGAAARAAPPRAEAPDVARRQVVDRAAPRLGLHPGEVVLRSGAAGQRAATFGARGLVEGGAIFLAPGLPLRDEAALLVHELAHLAQQRVAPRAGAPDAEAEARALAEAWRTGLPLWQPRATLPAGACAADIGVLTPPAPAPAPATMPPEPATTTDPAAQIGALVQMRWQAERQRILAQLSGLWISGGNVRECLRILDTLPFLAARALAASLPGEKRQGLATALDDGHHRSFPAAAVAALAALTPAEALRLEAGNVQGLDLAGADEARRRAALGTLRAMRSTVLRDLLRGERGAAFRAMLTAAPPAGTDAEAARIVAEILAAEAAEATALAEDTALTALVAELAGVLATPSAARAETVLDRLAELAPAPPLGLDTSPEPGPRLRFVVGRLEAEGHVERLIGALPNEQRSAAGSRAPKLLLVLAAREPSRNLSLVEGLLSYGAFDWAITDAEARFAYLVLRSLPVDAQERWKRLDQGSWLARLEENIPREDLLAGRYRGLGTDAGRFDPATTDRLTGDVDAAVRDIDAAMQRGLSPAVAPELVRRILALGLGRDRDRLRCAAIQRLDALGHVSRLLEALPDAYLMHEMWRAELLELMALRDPRHIEREARTLLSTGLLDWAVSAREAWLAFILVRSLTADDQARFEAEDPARWAAIQDNMTAAMRASSAVTMLGARAALRARDRLRDRLRDSRLWRAERATELRSLIIQLYAVDDRRWVFLRSRDMRADQVAGLDELVGELRLYHATLRPSFEPEQLRGPSPLEELFGTIGRFIVATPQLLGLLHQVLGALLSPEMRLRDLDLDLAQDVLGGDLMGTRLSPRAQRREADRRAGTPDAPDPNRLSIWIRPAEGRLGLTLPRLELDGATHLGTGWSARAGRTTLTGLEVVVDFSDRGYHRPVGARMSAGTLDVTDLVVAFAEEMAAVVRLGVRPIRIQAGQRGDETLDVPPPPNTIPIPIIGPLLNALSHLLALTGSIPGLPSSARGTDMLLPGVGSVASMILGTLTQGPAAIATEYSSLIANRAIAPWIEGMMGLVTDGVFRRPRTMEERGRDAAAMLRSFAVSVGDVTLEGVSLGGRQQVASVTLRDVFLGIGVSRTTALRHRIASLDRRIAAAERTGGEGLAALRTERAARQAELDGLATMEGELDTLESRHRWNAAALTPVQRARMAELVEVLRGTLGGALDIGGIGVGRMSGMVEAEGLDIGAIHAEAALPSRLGDYLPDEELIARFRREVAGSDTATVARAAQASGSVASLSLRGAGGAPALRIRAGAIPTAAALRVQVAAMPPGAPRDALAAWPDLLDRLAALEALPSDPVFDAAAAAQRAAVLGEETPEGARWAAWAAWLRAQPAAMQDLATAPRRAGGTLVGEARNAAEEAERQDLRDRAERFFGIEIARLGVGPISARYDPAHVALEAVAQRVEVGGLRAGATTVAAAEATGLRAGLALYPEGPGEAGFAAPVLERRGFPGARPAASFGADTLRLRGVEAPGATLADLQVQGLSGTLRIAGEELLLPDLRADRVELTGLNYASPERSLFSLGTTVLSDLRATIRLGTAPEAVAATPRRLVRDAAAASPVAPPPPERRIARATVERLRIGRIAAGRLGMDVALPAPGYRVEAVEGALVGFTLSDLRLDNVAAGWTLRGGHVGVEQLDALRFAVLQRALRGGPTTISGRLGSPAVEAGTAAGALGVELLEAGDRRIDLRGITLTEGEVGTPSGRVSIRRASLAGRLTQEAAGGTRFDGLGPLQVDLSALHWRTAGGMRMDAAGSIRIEDLHVAGRYDSTPDVPLPDGTLREGTSEVRIDRARIGRIAADNLRIRMDDLDMHLGRFDRRATPGEPPFEMREITVRGLRWHGTEGVTAGRVRTGRTALDIGGRVMEGLHVNGSLVAETIEAEFHRGGRVVGRLRGVSGDMAAGDTAAAKHHHASFAGIDSGTISYGPEGAEIGADGQPGLHIPILTLDELDWSNGRGFGLNILPGTGAITLLGTRARVRFERNRPGEGRGWLRRIVIRELEIPRSLATGLRVQLSDGASIRLDPTDEATIGPIRIRPAEGEDGLVVEHPRGGTGLMARGGLDIGAINLPCVAADVAGVLAANADIRAAALTVDFLGLPGVSHGMEVLLREPSITAIHANLGEAFGRVFMLRSPASETQPEYGLRASALRYSSRTAEAEGGAREEVRVSGASLTGLLYANPRWGLTAFVRRGEVAGDIGHDLAAGAGRIPRLVIGDAALSLDLATLLGPAGPADDSPVTSQDVLAGWNRVIEQLRPFGAVLNALHGDVSFNVVAGDDTFARLWLRFTNGQLDLQRVSAGLAASRLPYHAEHLGALRFHVRGNQLVAGVGNRVLGEIPLLWWTLATGGVEGARRGALLDAWHALQPDDPSRAWLAALIEMIAGGEPDAAAPRPAPKSLSINGIAADLSLTNAREIPVELGEGNRIVFAPNAVAHLAATGVIGGRAQGGATRPGRIDPIRLESAALSSVNLVFGGTRVDTGRIEITELHDARITFDGLRPQLLEGAIRRATADNITWRLPRRTGGPR